MKKKLLIETHSEYLLKRLRRRIAEGKIKHTDVAIYLLDREGDTSYLKNLEINTKGGFEFPKDFYGGELLKDTTEFIKHQF